MGDWTTARVEDRFESAADVFAQLPGVRSQSYFSAWPEYFHSFADKVGKEPQMRRPRPSPRQAGRRRTGTGVWHRADHLAAQRRVPSSRRSRRFVVENADRLSRQIVL